MASEADTALVMKIVDQLITANVTAESKKIALAMTHAVKAIHDTLKEEDE